MRRRRLLGRLAAVTASAIFLASSAGPLASGVFGMPAAVPDDVSPTAAPDLATGGQVEPIAYTFPDDGGSTAGAGGPSDPSIGKRPEFTPPKRPNSKSAVASEWTRDKRVWANPNGTFTVEVGDRLNYRGPGNSWRAIDLALRPEGQGIWRPTSVASDVRLFSDDPGGTIATLRGDAGLLGIRMSKPGRGVPANGRLDFAAEPGAPSMWVKPTDEGIEFGATFADAAASPRVEVSIDAGALTLVLDEETHRIRIMSTDAQGAPTEVGHVQAPHVFDEKAAEALQDEVTVTLEDQGDGTYLLAYELAPEWLAAPERAFPVTLDPTVCIKAGDASCSPSTGIKDIWFYSQTPGDWIQDDSTSYLHVGYYQATASNFHQTRSVLYFPGATLPDGAVITNATLAMRENHNYSGGSTAKIYARMVNKPGGWTFNNSSSSWTALAGAIRTGYDSPQYSPCNNGATDCTLNLDVSKMVRAWYTRRGQDWKPNHGIQLRYVTEDNTSTYYETSFYRYTEASSDRPKLTITYEVPGFELAFDPSLGTTYAPSAMILNQPTILPIVLKNVSGYSFDSNYRIGYRFMDVKGNVKQSGVAALGATIANGGSLTIPVSITPSSANLTQNQYTLRLDVAKVVGSDNLYASDWAKSSLFFSRDKKVLTSDSTRWTGSSVIERAEFSIRVTNGQGSDGHTETVETGDGDQLGINLWSRNLSYRGDTGISIADRVPLLVTYGYNSKDAASCTGYKGVLGACGWYTNWDERVIAGTTDDSYTYYTPDGDAFLTDSDFDGQLVGAPNQLSRKRVTLFDENRPTSGGTFVSAASEGIPTVSGPNVIKVPSGTTTTLAGFVDGGATREVNLNAFRWVNFSLRTGGASPAASTAICFMVHNKTQDTEKDVCAISGPAFTTNADSLYWTPDTVANNWSSHGFDLWGIVSGTVGNFTGFGKRTDDYFIKSVWVQSAGANSGSTYLDRLELVPYRPWRMDIAANVTNWTTGSSTYNDDESISSYHGAVQLTSDVTCTSTCFSSYAASTTISGSGYTTMSSLLSAPYLNWWWKKAGGQSAALTLCFTNNRTNATGEITYYAGPTPPAVIEDCAGVADPQRFAVQVSPTIPGHYTRVIRNILEDARQILNFYKDDDPGSTSDSPPTFGPSPDDTKWTGLRIDPVDGQFLLFTQPELNSTPLPPGKNRFADWNAGIDDLNYAGVIDSSDGPKDDFVAEYADGSSHFFNRDGLLTRIVTKNGAATDLEWSYGAGSGPSNYSLVAIHGASDNTDDGAALTTVYRHYIEVTRASVTGFTRVGFRERVGTTASLAGRRADFFVATTTGSTWGIGDLVKVSPARHNSTTCGTQPSGCTEFRYTSTTSHLINAVGDGRWDGTAGGASLGVTWTSGDPMEILDRSHSSAQLLRVLSWNRPVVSPDVKLFLRPLVQDASMLGANAAQHLDLSPEGSAVVEYMPTPCTGANCATWPSQANSFLGPRVQTTYEFDGLTNVNSVKTYRCPGVALAVDGCPGSVALASIERRGTNAGAKVDNYANALAASEVAWTQSGDQFLASLRDSAGLNPDLYRTEYVYNGVHSPILVRQPVFNRVVDYAGTVKATEGLTQYWRLGDASGTIANSVAGGAAGTAASITYGQSGALARDANTALGFNGTSSRVHASGATIPGSAYTLSGWVKLSAQPSLGDTGLFGRYVNDNGALVYIRDSNNTLAIAHNAGRVFSSATLDVNRWYHIAATWTGTRAYLYLDGALIASGAISGAPSGTPTVFEIGAYGNGSTNHFVNGSIDEVAVRNFAVDQSVLRAEYQAGRGVAMIQTETTYGSLGSMTNHTHLDANPEQSAINLVGNGDFETGLNSWSTNHGAVLTDAATVSPNDGEEAVLLTGTNYTEQLAQAVPGQRIHFQVSGKVTAGAALTYVVDYWNSQSGAWSNLIPQGSITTTGWSAAAFQYTVPVTNTTGLLKVRLSNGTATANAYADSVLLVTHYQAWQYLTPQQYYHGTNGRDAYIADGLVQYVRTIGSSPNAAIRRDRIYYDETADHQGIFPVKKSENYGNGVAGPAPEDDVISLTTFDRWGRPIQTTDPDGVVATTVYHATNLTDVIETADGLGNTTTFTYDTVGNLLTTTTPLGRVTTSTWDFRNQELTSTGPDGVVGKTVYDNYGRVAESWDNWVDGNPATGGGTDDVLTLFSYDAWGRTIQQDVDCGSVAACATGGLDARTTTTYDLLGNVIKTTVYAGSNGTSPRATTNHFEIYDPPAGTKYDTTILSRLTATGTEEAIAPTDSAVPFCPGSATVRCNASSMWKVNGIWTSAVDMNGRAFANADAYGKVTLSDLDLAGRPVIVTANYDPAAGSTSDTNVVTRTEYNLAGGPIATWDAEGRHDQKTYDALGRLLEVKHLDKLGIEFKRETTVYKPSGRIDRTWDGASWTKTLYDGAGRAYQTVANWDQAGNAGMNLDAFEDELVAWQSTPSGFFTTVAAAQLNDDTNSSGLLHEWEPANTGNGRLRFRTDATSGGSGIWLDLSGQTYQSGHVYKAAFDLRSTVPGVSLTASIGQDQSGGTFGQLPIVSTAAWARYIVTWTATSTVSTPVHFAISKGAAGSNDIYVDNLVIWDATSGWADKGIVSSRTAYNKDGEVIATTLPPGDPGSELPMITTVGLDPVGRTVATTIGGNGSSYSSVVMYGPSLAYWSLDERSGPARNETYGWSLNPTGTVQRGVAGGIDAARTAYRFTGSGFIASSGTDLYETTDMGMDAWIRTETVPGQTTVVVSNGNATNGWGIAIDSTGKASGFTTSSGTFTTMASTETVTDGAWHHIALWRGTSTWSIAVDGVAKSLTNNSSTFGTFVGPPGFSIGGFNDGTRGYSGDIDEVAIYFDQLSAIAPANYAAGRVAAADPTTALTTRTNFDRLGRNTDTWEPDQVRTRMVYDRLGNLTETILNYRDGTPTGGTGDDDVRSKFAYNVLGEMIGYCPAVQVASAGNCSPGTTSEPKAWHYEFDAMGRQTKTIAPVNSVVVAMTTEETVYQPGGRIDRTCRYPATGGSCGSFDSRHVDFTYDGLGRILTQKTYDRGASPAADTLKFTKTLTWNKDGSAATVNEGADTLTYVYDDAGRVKELKRGPTVLTAYTYTAGTSTIASRTDGTQGATSFLYDWAGRITTVDPPDTFVSGTVTRTYRLDGLLASQSFPSSITETMAYDAVKRPVSISLGAAGSISQAFDRGSEIVSDSRSLTGITGDAGAGTQTFTYDNLSRLTGSTGLAVARSYQYDLDGNRTRNVEGATTTDYTYDRADQIINQTIGVTTRAFDYDRYGNMLSSYDSASAATTYGFDEANRLKTIAPPGGAAAQITFTLDGLGRHATRAVNGSTTDTYQYVSSEENAWQTGSATTTSSILDSEGARVAVKTGASVFWLLFDLHGSVVAMVPAGSTTLSDAYRFDGWGEQIASAGTAVNPWRYRGLLNIGADFQSGALLDMNARDYSPQLGVFTQEDSVQGKAANPLSMNRYLYAQANPATLIDPDGHDGFDLFAAIGNVVDFGTGFVEGVVTSVVDTGKALVDTAVAVGGCALDSSCRDAAAQAIVQGAQAFARDPVKAVTTATKAVVDGAVGAIKSTVDRVNYAIETGNFRELGRMTGAVAANFIPVGGLAAAGLRGLTSAGRGALSLAARGSSSLLARGATSIATNISRAGRYLDDAFGRRNPLTSCKHSFSPDTAVATEHGSVPIGALEVGDEVLAYNEETGETDSYPITTVHINDDPVTGQVVVDGETIQTTPEHPFYTIEAGWLEAQLLTVGMHTRALDGSMGVVESVEFSGGRAIMYNLTVDEAHTYFVGDGQWLVHNANCPLGEGASASRAGELFDMLPDYAQWRRTFAEARGKMPDGSIGSSLTSSGARAIPPGIRNTLRAGEHAAKGERRLPGRSRYYYHAERAAAREAKRTGQTIDYIDASRMPCSVCQRFAFKARITLYYRGKPLMDI